MATKKNRFTLGQRILGTLARVRNRIIGRKSITGRIGSAG